MSIRIRVILLVAAAVILSAAPAAAATRILFVVDASSSTLDAWEGTTRWAAIQDAVAAALGAHGTEAEFGLMVYPGPGAGCTVGSVEVDVGPGTASAINTWLGTTIPPVSGASSPMGQSLVTASQYSLIIDPAHDNSVVFLVEGIQYCSVVGGTRCATQTDCDLMGVASCPTCLPNAMDSCYCVQNWPVLGAIALRDAGVDTYVVGVADGTIPFWLNQVADEGGTATDGCDPMATSPSCYTQASTPAALDAAVTEVVQRAVASAAVPVIPSIGIFGLGLLAAGLLAASALTFSLRQETRSRRRALRG